MYKVIVADQVVAIVDSFNEAKFWLQDNGYGGYAYNSEDEDYEIVKVK